MKCYLYPRGSRADVCRSSEEELDSDVEDLGSSDSETEAEDEYDLDDDIVCPDDYLSEDEGINLGSDGTISSASRKHRNHVPIQLLVLSV